MSQNYEASFRYVFNDLLEILDLGHAGYALSEVYENYFAGEYFSTHILTINEFCQSGGSTDKLEKVLSQAIKLITQTIKENYLDYKMILPYYQNKIRDIITTAEAINTKIISNEFEETKKLLKLNYEGMLHIENPIRTIPYQKPKDSKDDVDKVYRLLLPFFEIILKNLKKLLNGLIHLEIIYTERLSEKAPLNTNTKINTELIRMVRNGEINELFQRLNELPKLGTHIELTTLSSRYYHNEKRLRQGLITNNQYEVTFNKLTREILYFLQENS